MDVFQLRSAIREEQIAELVERFYDQARTDPVLGAIFGQAVPEERWPKHIETITRFWSTALLGSGSYRANPITPHAALGDLTRAHFDRWLELFESTCHQVFEPTVAESVHKRALRMARHMEAVLRG